MRTGPVVSGAAHAALIGVALFGLPWINAGDPPPLNITEVEFIDGTDFDARLSTAPVVPNQGPAEMAPPQDRPTPELAVDQPDQAVARLDEPALDDSAPPQPAPEEPEIVIPAPPVEVPTEAPRLSIAEVPSPDALDLQAKEPESPPSTEPLQPLASAPSAIEAPSPSPPPEPEPELAEAEPEPEPQETEAEPAPEALAEAQPRAPESHAPQQARLPVAKPAEVARAAQASSAPTRRSEPDAEPEETEREPSPEPEPTVAEAPEAEPSPEPTPAAGSTAQFAPKLTRGEEDALRIGIKQYFVYNGNRADRSLRVVVEIRLDESGRIVEGPEKIEAEGGDPGAQTALFNSGRRALLKAQNAGVFSKLPAEKHGNWKRINITFYPNEDIGFSSS